MGLYKERLLQVALETPSATADVSTIDLGADWGSGDHCHLTPTRVDTAIAGSETGQIDYNATEATCTANFQTAIQALGGIYATATVANGASARYKVITVPGGYDVTWAVTNPVGHTPGSTTETTPGSCAYTGYIPIGRFAIVKRLRLAGFYDNAVDIVITDLGGGTGYRTVYSKTAIDCSTASADTPYDKMLTRDGVAGEDANAASNVNGGLFEGPLKVVVTTSSPVTTRSLTPYVDVFVRMGRSSGLKQRGTGAFTTQTATVNLGAPVACVKRIYLKASADTSATVSIADAYSKVFFAETDLTDYTTAVDAVLSMEGIDQADNAVADLLDVVVKSPVTVTLNAAPSSGTFQVIFYTET